MTHALETVNPHYAARIGRRAAPQARAGPAGLRPPAACPHHRQPGAAPDQPLSQYRRQTRRVRHKRLSRQLRRQAHQAICSVTSARARCSTR